MKPDDRLLKIEEVAAIARLLEDACSASQGSGVAGARGHWPCGACHLALVSLDGRTVPEGSRAWFLTAKLLACLLLRSAGGEIGFVSSRKEVIMERVPSVTLYRPRVKKKRRETGKLVVSQIWWMHWRQNGRDRRESTGTE